MADKQKVPVLYKPFGSPGSGNAGKATIATAADAKSVDIVDSKGNVISHTKKDTIPHTPEPGAIPGPYNQNWWAGSPNDIPAGSSIRVTNSDGSYSYAALKDPYTSYRGFVDPGEGESPDQAADLPPNSHSGDGGSGVPNGFQPGQQGQYGATPAYIGNLFPNAVLAKYNPITAAPYTFTDPMKFAQQFGEFNRGEIQKNFDLSKDLALNELDTELSSLKNFVPAAAALKRQETSLDNQFNQQQRTQQVNSVLPNANSDLEAQRVRANSYANGQIPDAVQDRAFELGVRSAAADSASAGGFGQSSSVARKSSDLLSATQRVGLSKYGDQLVSSNISENAALNLAPTEYSNAGSSINVNPSLSASQLINSNLNAINGLTTISPTTGLQSTTQQNQFTTTEEQNTRTFNAGNELQLSETNAAAQNNFALDKFGYQATYATSVANSAQNNINTNFQLQQQQMYNQLLQQYLSQAQNAGTLGSLGQLGGLLGSLGGGAGKGVSAPGNGAANTGPGLSTTSKSFKGSSAGADPGLTNNGGGGPNLPDIPDISLPDIPDFSF